VASEPYKDKHCKDCNEIKMIEDFSVLRSGKPDSYCKKCKARRSRAYYHKNKGRGQLSFERNRDSNQRFLWDILVSSSCMDCNESDPRVLQFDHVRGEKVADIAVMLRQHRNREILEKEVKKCDIVCANCHTKRTFKRSNSWKHRYYLEVI